MFVAPLKHTLVQILHGGPRRSQISAKGSAGAGHCAQHRFILSPIHITCYPLFVLHPLHLFSVILLLLFNLKPTQAVRMNTFICVPIQAKVSVSWLQEGLESSCWKRNLTPPCISMWPWWSLGSLTNTKRDEAASYILWGCRECIRFNMNIAI